MVDRPDEGPSAGADDAAGMLSVTPGQSTLSLPATLVQCLPATVSTATGGPNTPPTGVFAVTRNTFHWLSDGYQQHPAATGRLDWHNSVGGGQKFFHVKQVAR